MVNGHWLAIFVGERSKLYVKIEIRVVQNNMGSELLMVDLEIFGIYILDIDLAENITKEGIEIFLRENGVQMLDCWTLKSKVYNSVSARVQIPLDKREKLLNADFWPKGITIRSWVIKPRACSSRYDLTV